MSRKVAAMPLASTPVKEDKLPVKSTESSSSMEDLQAHALQVLRVWSGQPLQYGEEMASFKGTMEGIPPGDVERTSEILQEALSEAFGLELSVTYDVDMGVTPARTEWHLNIPVKGWSFQTDKTLKSLLTGGGLLLAHDYVMRHTSLFPLQNYEDREPMRIKLFPKGEARTVESLAKNVLSQWKANSSWGLSNGLYYLEANLPSDCGDKVQGAMEALTMALAPIFNDVAGIKTYNPGDSSSRKHYKVLFVTDGHASVESLNAFRAAFDSKENQLFIERSLAAASIGQHGGVDLRRN